MPGLRRGIFFVQPFPLSAKFGTMEKTRRKRASVCVPFPPPPSPTRWPKLCIQANTHLPPDIVSALDRTRREEPWPLAKETLGLLWDNLELAEREELPVCQDTGMACVFVELGQEVHIQGDFEQAVHEGVRRGYGEGYLRKSIVGDPLRRVNTEDNTPAAITLRLVPGDGCRITVAPKGFGSENMSRLGCSSPLTGWRA